MIRPAEPGDAKALAALLNHWIETTAVTFNPTPKTETDIRVMIAAKAAAGHAFLVAVQDGALVGQASYGQFRGGEGYRTCMEHSISLAPHANGRGIGRALMAAIEDHARTQGAHQMIAAVSGENPDGQAFHTRLGYRPIATIPEAGHKFGRFMDLVLMQKFL
ncbi:MAG: N-acetyltransferase family protein [Tabrizicola sp.]|uniref:GNAT family N-acetyltransferase n=1 Tax=Tabrizicola sp. TaxID=2005166 RepID=UPI002ABC045C|nr:N-acetyltransferase family protein [Tabrizicola sp.]MDZ4086565.1 N-acetyltransferase family protein [Tabrizicola sp.]